MKKVFMSAAVVAMIMAAASCQCNGSKKADDACCEEAAEKIEDAVEEAVEAVKEAVAE